MWRRMTPPPGKNWAWYICSRSKSVSALEKAVALHPDMPEAHNNLGGVWFEQRARAESAFRRNYREAVRIHPDFDRAHLSLGVAFAASGDAP